MCLFLMCGYSAYYVKTKNNRTDNSIIVVTVDCDLCDNL